MTNSQPRPYLTDAVKTDAGAAKADAAQGRKWPASRVVLGLVIANLAAWSGLIAGGLILARRAGWGS